MPGRFVNLPLCQSVCRRLISTFLHKFHSECHLTLLQFLYFTYTSSYCNVTWHFPPHLQPFLLDITANSKNDEQNLLAVIFMPGHFVNLPLWQSVSRRLFSTLLCKFQYKCGLALMLFN
jgi:hypothetical protein